MDRVGCIGCLSRGSSRASIVHGKPWRRLWAFCSIKIGQEFEYAVGAEVGSLWAALPPPAPRFDGTIWQLVMDQIYYTAMYAKASKAKCC